MSGIVVLSYDDGPALRCITTLLRTGIKSDHILVIHNPGPSRPLFSPPDGVFVTNMHENVGYGRAMNEGMSWWRARGQKQAVLLTHDAVVEGPTLTSLLGRLGDGVAAAGPILRTDGGMPFSAGGTQDRLGNIQHLPVSGDGLRYVDWIDGSVVAVDLALVPDFRDDFFLYWEDVAFGADLRRRGLRLVVDQSLSATSFSGAPGRSDLFCYLMWRNRLRQLRSDRAIVPIAYTLGRMTRASLRRRRPLRIYAQAMRDGLFSHDAAPPTRLGPAS